MADTPVNQEQIDTLQAQATDLKAQRDAAYDAYRITSKAQAATEAAITAEKQAAYNNGKAANAAAEAAGQPAPYPSAAKMLAADPGYAAAIAADAEATTTMAQANSVLSPLQASLNTVNQQIAALKGAAAPPTNIAAATTAASSTATAKVDGSTDTTVSNESNPAPASTATEVIQNSAPATTTDPNNTAGGGTLLTGIVGSSSPAATTDPSIDHGPAYDDAGVLNVGWALADGGPIWVGLGAAPAGSTATGIGNSGPATAPPVISPGKLTSPFTKDDWRIRLSLAPSATYLYADAGMTPTNILFPLVATNGVVFPYSPTINTSYKASYDATELTHSNYKLPFYKNSSVDDVSLTAEFTAQDTAEANYMLAVIHFFKAVTKMFYGKDSAPHAGTPPPLLYLSGYGAYQFDNHPLLVSTFAYNLPNDVDYIRAGTTATWGGVDITNLSKGTAVVPPKTARMQAAGLPPAGVKPPATFTSTGSQDTVTYVPTKISITLTLIPVVTRNDISKNFSVKDYATGKLSRSTRPGGGGGIW